MGKDWLIKAPGTAERPKRGLANRTSLPELRRQIKERFGRATAVLLLDTSGSMLTDDKLSHARSGAVQFAGKAISGGYKVGIVSFDTVARVVCQPNVTVSELQSLLGALQAKGSTNMAAGLRLAQEMLGEEGRRAAIVATDGVPDDRHAALAVAEQMKKAGIQIITIGTPDADDEFLRRVASASELSTVVANSNLGREIAATADLLRLPGPRSGS